MAEPCQSEVARLILESTLNESSARHRHDCRGAKRDHEETTAPKPLPGFQGLTNAGGQDLFLPGSWNLAVVRPDQIWAMDITYTTPRKLCRQTEPPQTLTQRQLRGHYRQAEFAK